MLRWVLPFILVSASIALYTKEDGIEMLTDSNFATKVLKSDSVWIVEYFSPNCGHCHQLVPEYKKLAKLLKGVAKVGAVDATVQHSTTQSANIQGYPTLKIYGFDKKSPVDYNGQRTANSMAEKVKDQIVAMVNSRIRGPKTTKKDSKKSKSGKSEKGGNSGEVITLTDANFDELVLNSKDGWMVEFFAPWCGHCKNLEPEWKKAAKKMNGAIKFGALDATVHQATAQRFGIGGFPTIKYFGPGSTEADAIDYQGGRSSSDLVSFAEQKADSIAPAPEIVEGVNKAIVDDACNSKQLCIFAFLPHILDCQSKCRNEKIQMLNSISESFKSRKWGWVWVEAGSQPSLEETFGIGGFGYPAMSVLSPRKSMFTNLKGAFQPSSIKELLNGIGVGKARIESIDPSKLVNGSLKINDIKPWDGKDGEIYQEEEIDISDIDLDEKTEL